MANVIASTVLITILVTGGIVLATVCIRSWWKEKWQVVIDLKRDMYGVPHWFSESGDGPNGMNVARLHQRVARLETLVPDPETDPEDEA